MVKWIAVVFLWSSQVYAVSILEWFQTKPIEASKACDSTQELVASYEYLRNKGELAGVGDNALSVARKVSRGCTGAAKRFINTANLLLKAEIDHNTILQVASDMALKTDATASAFFDIFERTYLSSYLDLDAYSSLKIATNLTTLYKGDTSYVADDYSRIVDFCLSAGGLQLSKPRCAKMGAQFSAYGERHKRSVFDQFVSMYRYLQGLKQEQPTIEESLELMDRVLSVNEKAFENFKQAFEYSIRESGFNRTKKEAIQIGLEMARNSAPIEATTKN